VFARAGKWRKGLQFFHQMRKCGQAPNRLTYNALISACASAAEANAALQIYNEMLQVRQIIFIEASYVDICNAQAGIRADSTRCIYDSYPVYLR
jgi:pentatricopeptide repeat protein